MTTGSAPLQWIDTHCHLDAREFDADRPAVVERANAAGVTLQVIPAVGVFNFDSVRALAHEHGQAYALGIHPLCVGAAAADDLDRLEQALRDHRDDPRLVAVGEIGVDLFVPGLAAIRPRQEHFYREQLKIARRAGLPVLVHVRRSSDAVLAGLRRIEVPGGIINITTGLIDSNGSAVTHISISADGNRYAGNPEWWVNGETGNDGIGLRLVRTTGNSL